MSLWATGLWVDGLWVDGLWAVDASATSSITPAAGTSTTSTLVGRRLARATISAAAGVSTTSALASEAGTGIIAPAAGVSTTGTLTSISTARTAIVPAAGVSTTFPLESATGVVSISPAAGISTAATLAGRAIARASLSSAAGLSTTHTLIALGVDQPISWAGGGSGGGLTTRQQDREFFDRLIPDLKDKKPATVAKAIEKAVAEKGELSSKALKTIADKLHERSIAPEGKPIVHMRALEMAVRERAKVLAEEELEALTVLFNLER